MRTRPSILAVLAIALALCAGMAAEAFAGALTGTYVGAGKGQAFILQIVETGSQLTGRYEAFIAKPGGKFDDKTFAFSAAVDGDHFAGTLKNLGLLGATIPVSGDLNGATLRLEGSSTFHLTLTRGGQADFRRSVADIRASTGAAQRIVLVNDLVRRMRAFEGRELDIVAELSVLEARLASNGAKMSSQLDRERSILGDGQHSVERGQVSVEIHQLGVDSSQVRATARAAFGELDSTSKRLLVEASDVKMSMTCPSAKPQALHDACQRFAEEDISFETSVDQMRAAFAKFDEVWGRESAEQEHLVRASDVAVN